MSKIIRISVTNKVKNPKLNKLYSKYDEIYEAFKNVPISETKDMRKFKDMPKSFQEYYKSSKGSNDRYININNYCNFRFV
jgi:hypothetical protein